MRMEERDEMVQYLIQIRKKVEETERNFKEALEMIDTYKSVMINTQIEELKMEKTKKWWQK